MTKAEIALELVLAMLEKNRCDFTADFDNQAYGKAVAELYNSVFDSLSIAE